VEVLRDALALLNEQARGHLRAGATSSSLGTEVGDHLGSLDRRLGGKQAELPITAAWIRGWNDGAQALVKRLIAAAQTVVEPAPSAPSARSAPALAPAGPPAALAAPTPTGQATPRAVLLESQFDPADPDAVSSFLGQVRKALESGKHGTKGQLIRVALIREVDE